MKLKDTGDLEESYDKSRPCIKKQRYSLCWQRSVESRLWFFQCHVQMWELDHKEGWRTDAFELMWWRLLRVPWTARRSNQSILKEINPEYSLEGLRLKLQYLRHLMQTADSLEKTLMLGKIEDRRRRRWLRMRWLDASLTQWTWVWANARK